MHRPERVTSTPAQAKQGDAPALKALLTELRPMFTVIPKAKTAKLVRTIIDAVATVPNTTQLQVRFAFRAEFHASSLSYAHEADAALNGLPRSSSCARSRLSGLARRSGRSSGIAWSSACRPCTSPSRTTRPRSLSSARARPGFEMRSELANPKLPRPCAE